MSAELAARAAIVAALGGDEALAGLVNQISDGEPVKASPPWLLVGAAVATGWGARGVDGATLRQTLELSLRGDQLSAVTAILDRVDDVLRGMDDDLGDWRVTSLRFERSRIRRSGTNGGPGSIIRSGWRGSSEQVEGFFAQRRRGRRDAEKDSGRRRRFSLETILKREGGFAANLSALSAPLRESF